MRLADDIKSGLLDDELVEIEQAVSHRRTQQKEAWREKLNIGDEVKFVKEISPKYLRGLRAEVSGFEGQRVLVSLDEHARAVVRGRRFDYDGNVRCYRSHLEPVA